MPSKLKNLNLDFVIDYLGFSSAVTNKVNYLRQDFVGMPTVIADTANSQRDRLPQVVIVNLSYGNLELALNSADNRFYDLSLAFERPVLRQMEFDFTYTNVHDLLSFYRR
jgi:hypothetical protein